MVTLSAPGSGFVACLGVTTWVEHVPSGAVPWLLLTPPPGPMATEVSGVVECELRAMARALHLSTEAESAPDIGERIMMRGPVTALDYGHDHYLLRVPHPSPGWRGHAFRTGRVCVALGLVPLPNGADQSVVERYVSSVRRCGLLTGVSGVRG